MRGAQRHAVSQSVCTPSGGLNNGLHRVTCKYTTHLPFLAGGTAANSFIHPAIDILLIPRPTEGRRLSWPSWLTHSGRLAHEVVTRQTWIRRRSGKVRQLQTDVLTTEPRQCALSDTTGRVVLITVDWRSSHRSPVIRRSKLILSAQFRGGSRNLRKGERAVLLESFKNFETLIRKRRTLGELFDLAQTWAN